MGERHSYGEYREAGGRLGMGGSGGRSPPDREAGGRLGMGGSGGRSPPDNWRIRGLALRGDFARVKGGWEFGGGCVVQQGGCPEPVCMKQFANTRIMSLVL